MAGPTSQQEGSGGGAGLPSRRPALALLRLKGRRPGGAPAGSAPRRRFARPLPVMLVVLTLLAGGGAWVVYGTSLLELRTVEVTGTQVLTAAQVRAAARVQTGRPLADVDTDAVQRRLRDGLPRIEEVEVGREWPHTLRLKVTEREPVAVLKDGGSVIEVDRTGARFATVPEAPKGVPLVELKPDQSASLRHFGTRRLLQASVRVAADLPERVRKASEAIEVRSYDNIELRLSGGRRVVWGSEERGPEKAKSLIALMTAAKDAKHYDVSAPSAPAAGS